VVGQKLSIENVATSSSSSSGKKVVKKSKVEPQENDELEEETETEKGEKKQQVKKKKSKEEDGESVGSSSQPNEKKEKKMVSKKKKSEKAPSTNFIKVYDSIDDFVSMAGTACPITFIDENITSELEKELFNFSSSLFLRAPYKHQEEMAQIHNNLVFYGPFDNNDAQSLERFRTMICFLHCLVTISGRSEVLSVNYITCSANKSKRFFSIKVDPNIQDLLSDTAKEVSYTFENDRQILVNTTVVDNLDSNYVTLTHMKVCMGLFIICGIDDPFKFVVASANGEISIPLYLPSSSKSELKKKIPELSKPLHSLLSNEEYAETAKDAFAQTLKICMCSMKNYEKIFHDFSLEYGLPTHDIIHKRALKINEFVLINQKKPEQEKEKEKEEKEEATEAVC
jgi:hypothetical protein